MDPLTSQSSTRARGRTRRVRRASFTTSPPVRRLSAIARRRSIRGPRPRTHRRVRRSPGVQTRRDSAAPASAISSAVNAAKSLSARPPRSLQVFSPRFGVGASPSASSAPEDAAELIGREDFLDLDRRGARLVGPRVAAGLSLVVFAPEGRERPVEDRDLFLAMDEQRTARVIHLVACAEVHMSERLDDVEQTPGMDVDARAPQDAAEDQQVIEETGHRPSLVSRPRRASRDRAIEQLRRPASAERLQIFLRFQHDAERFFDRVRIERVPVERDERGHPVDGLGHPGHFVQVCALAAPAPWPSPAPPAAPTPRERARERWPVPSRTTGTQSTDTGTGV